MSSAKRTAMHFKYSAFITPAHLESQTFPSRERENPKWLRRWVELGGRQYGLVVASPREDHPASEHRTNWRASAIEFAVLLEAARYASSVLPVVGVSRGTYVHIKRNNDAVPADRGMKLAAVGLTLEDATQSYFKSDGANFVAKFGGPRRMVRLHDDYGVFMPASQRENLMSHAEYSAHRARVEGYNMEPKAYLENLGLLLAALDRDKSGRGDVISEA